MSDSEDKEFEVDYLGEFEKSIDRFIRKKRFKSLPDQIEDLVKNFERGEFEGDKLTHTCNECERWSDPFTCSSRQSMRTSQRRMTYTRFACRTRTQAWENRTATA